MTSQDLAAAHAANPLTTHTGHGSSDGAQFTPRWMAEAVTDPCMEALVYAPGPHQFNSVAMWQLRPAQEILDLKVADIAVGCGAFPVAACRTLAEALIQPSETVHVPLGPLYTATSTIVAAAPNTPYRREVLVATRAIASGVAVAVRYDTEQTIALPAELLWWVVQGAEEIGHDQALSPLSPLFDAVEQLTEAIRAQPPRTDHGMTAIVEAEVTCAIYAHVIRADETGGDRG